MSGTSEEQGCRSDRRGRARLRRAQTWPRAPKRLRRSTEVACARAKACGFPAIAFGRQSVVRGFEGSTESRPTSSVRAAGWPRDGPPEVRQPVLSDGLSTIMDSAGDELLPALQAWSRGVSQSMRHESPRPRSEQSVPPTLLFPVHVPLLHVPFSFCFHLFSVSGRIGREPDTVRLSPLRKF